MFLLGSQDGCKPHDNETVRLGITFEIVLAMLRRRDHCTSHPRLPFSRECTYSFLFLMGMRSYSQEKGVCAEHSTDSWTQQRRTFLLHCKGSCWHSEYCHIISCYITGFGFLLHYKLKLHCM